MLTEGRHLKVVRIARLVIEWCRCRLHECHQINGSKHKTCSSKSVNVVFWIRNKLWNSHTSWKKIKHGVGSHGFSHVYIMTLVHLCCIVSMHVGSLKQKRGKMITMLISCIMSGLYWGLARNPWHPRWGGGKGPDLSPPDMNTL